jgi:hypothetical protein
VLLSAAAFATSSFAQTPTPTPPPQAFQVTIVQVKPEMEREWREYLQNDANPAQVKAGVKRRDTFTTATFGEAGEYVLVQPIESLAQFDDNAVGKALGPDGYQALLAKRARLINGSRSFVLTARPELGFAPAPGYQTKLMVSSTSTVVPGHVAEFLKNGKEFAAVMAKTNAKGMLVGQVGLGGNPNEFVTIALFDSFTDLANFPAAYAKAAADAKLGPAPAGVVANTEWRVYRFVPELSIGTAPQKTEKK